MSNDAVIAAWNQLFNKVLHALNVTEPVTGIVNGGNTEEVILRYIEDLKRRADAAPCEHEWDAIEYEGHYFAACKKCGARA